jgi:hypothetical protein
VRVEEFRLGIKNSRKAEGTNETFLPGEIEPSRNKVAFNLPEALIAAQDTRAEIVQALGRQSAYAPGR